MEKSKILDILNFYEEFDVISKSSFEKIANEINNSKPLIECDLFSVNFETNTIEISIPKYTFRNPVHAGKVKVDISGIMD